jgi:carbonic anhydrase/acetyltransferase-like protein (isoleucine patch superfamily)
MEVVMGLYEVNGQRPQVYSTAWVAPTADIIGDVRIGPGCYVGWQVVLRADHGPIIIGEGSAIEEGVLIHVLPRSIGGGCSVGKQVTIGHGATLHNCRAEDFAVIGIRAVICNFAVIGEWAILGEMSLVVSHQVVPKESVAVGQPAEVVGRITEKQRRFWRKGKLLYQHYASTNRENLVALA